MLEPPSITIGGGSVIFPIAGSLKPSTTVIGGAIEANAGNAVEFIRRSTERIKQKNFAIALCFIVKSLLNYFLA
jgi:hypothetical protein